MRVRRKVVIVSYAGPAESTPRGRRIRAVARELERTLSVELITGPRGWATAPHVSRGNGLSRRLRRLVARLWLAVFVDRHELWSQMTFWRWRTDADVALLMGAPFSPIVAAARKLRAVGVPYIVDVGDPWVLTGAEETSSRRPIGLAMWRARRAEARLWAGAMGAVVTSRRVGDAIGDRFPNLRVLVRPNGYEVVKNGPIAYERNARDRTAIRLVYYGTLYGPRVSVGGFLRALLDSELWKQVSFTQYGDVWDDALDDLDAAALSGVEVVRRPAVPWERAIHEASHFDAAMVIANLSGLGPPSKVFQYMTLPLPRIVLTVDCERDETARFVTASELQPPASESWPRVAQDISNFVLTVAAPIHRAKSAREQAATIRLRNSEGR